MKNILWENVVKNIIVLFVLFFSYSEMQTFIHSSNLTSDNPIVGNLLVVVSIIAVTACFGNFAFTYEKIKITSFSSRLLAHLTTGLLMLIIGLSLEMTSVLSSVLLTNFFFLNVSLLMLYIASILYDFWDLRRSES